MSKIKIALADDNKQFKNAIRVLFKPERDFEIVLEADHGIHLLEQLKSKQPDVILMDIRMPKMDGIEASKKVKELYPKIKIITFSQYDYESNIVAMYIIGVKSFIGKEDRPEELFKAIRTVYTSGTYMTDMAAEIIQRNLAYKAKESNNGDFIQENLNIENFEFNTSNLLKLSKTELLVLWYVAHFKSIKEIAEAMFLSPNTINNHEAKIRQKLEISGKNSLLRYCTDGHIKTKLCFEDGEVRLRK
jgi:DNA-binding NarL/FixJ family response regulator